jgi:excinuclease ABC subunit B
MEGARASPAAASRGKGAAKPALIRTPRNLAEAEREITRLGELMYRHARNLEFEQAATIRDQIEALRQLELELGEAAAAAGG